jgi:hypothetical protein
VPIVGIFLASFPIVGGSLGVFGVIRASIDFGLVGVYVY